MKSRAVTEGTNKSPPATHSQHKDRMVPSVSAKLILDDPVHPCHRPKSPHIGFQPVLCSCPTLMLQIILITSCLIACAHIVLALFVNDRFWVWQSHSGISNSGNFTTIPRVAQTGHSRFTRSLPNPANLPMLRHCWSICLFKRLLFVSLDTLYYSRWRNRFFNSSSSTLSSSSCDCSLWGGRFAMISSSSRGL